MQLTTAEVDTPHLEYDSVVFNKAKKATCFDLRDEYKSQYTIDCNSKGEVTIGPYDIVTNNLRNAERYYYTRNIVEITKKNKKRYNPILIDQEIEIFTRLMVEFDERMNFNIKNINDFYNSGLNLKKVDYISKFQEEAGSLLPVNLIDYNRIEKNLSNYFEGSGSYSYRSFFVTNEKYKINYQQVDLLRSKSDYLDVVNYQIKNKFVNSHNLNLSFEFCSEFGDSMKVCSVEGTPYKKSNWLENKDLKLSSYYKYDGVYSYIVEVENKSNDYMTMLNIDNLFSGEFYSADLSSPSLPPRSTKQFKMNFPKGFSTGVSVNNKQDSVSYGFTAQYKINNKVSIFNEVINFNPVVYAKAE
ncbi:hypothetical protein [Photobacterium indicum]|uniref:hypothetical protein n=1 Tax=Photobacterium indicum TaxID=81447 RepID=UPI003D11A33F